MARCVRWGPYLALLVGSLIVFGQAIGPADGLYYRDHSLAFRPLWWSIISQLEAGRFPLIDITHAHGLPHELATTYALFTPTTLVFFMAPFEQAYDFFIIIHYLILGTGVLGLARALGADPAPSAVAAVVVTFCGPVVSFENLVVGLQGIAWTPWLLWAVLNSMRRPGLCATAYLALASALALQGIMPEILLLDLVFVAGLWLHERRPISKALAATWLIGLTLGLVVASPDIIPLLHGLKDSRRFAGLAYDELSGWAVSPPRLLEVLVPGFWTPPDLFFINLPRITDNPNDPSYLPSLYFGSALALAAAAATKHWPRTGWLLAAALVFLVVSMGTHAPLHWALTKLPLLGSARYAVKYMVLFAVPVGILAAGGVASLPQLARRMLIAGSVQLIGLVCLLAVVSLPEFYDYLDLEVRPLANVSPFEIYTTDDMVLRLLGRMKAGLFHAIGAVLAMAVVLIFYLTGFLNEGRTRFALLSVLVLDLGFAGKMVTNTGPVEAETKFDTVADELPGHHPWVWLTSSGPVPNIPGATPFEAYLRNQGLHGGLAWKHFRVFRSEELEGLGLDPLHATFHSVVRDFQGRPEWTESFRPVLRQAGVRAFILARKDRDPILGVLEGADRKVWLHDLQARPYLYARTSWNEPANLGEAARIIATAAPGGVALEAGDGPTPSPDCDPETSLVSWTPGVVEAEVNTTCTVLVSVDEVYYPGWRGWVDGMESSLARVDAGYIALQVDAGRHHIEFRYVSMSQRLLPLMLLGLLIVGALWTWGRIINSRHQ